MSQFNFEEFLNVAWFLKNSNLDCSKEAKSRSAVSRAYYAAFHKTRIYLIDWWGHSFSPNHEAHQEVIDDLVLVGLDEESKKLVTLRGWRNQCDYKESVAGLADMLTNAIDQAQEVIDSVAPY